MPWSFWIIRRGDDRPFFLNISFARPHSPYIPPQAYWDMYIDADLPDPYVGDWATCNDDANTAVGHQCLARPPA